MADALFTTNRTVEGNDTQLSFYKHDTVTDSYYCVICTSWGSINGTYTMRTDDHVSWHFAEEVPEDLKGAEADLSQLIYESEHSHAA